MATIQEESNPIHIQTKMADFYAGISKTIRVLSSLSEVTNETTPHDVVLQVDKVRLLRYRSDAPLKHKVPVLVVYALINRPYILDLQNKSMIKSILEAGFDVYLIDWGSPDVEESTLTIHDYLKRYLDRCVNAVRKISKSEKVTLFGYCMGGTFSAIYTVLCPEKVKNIITLAPPIDCSKDTTVFGSISRFLDADLIADTIGNIPPALQYQFFMMLKPFKHFLGKYYEVSQRTSDSSYVKDFLRIEKWLWDTAPLPGEVFRQWVKDIYQKNLLAKNRLQIGPHAINLKKIDIPLLNIVAEHDHLVTPESSLALNHLVSSKDNTPMSFPTGHVGLCASTFAQREVWPKIIKWLEERS
ncbi:MAG: class III poly(R)-hydroxyalkanoic acid synthase subunit PhaC [Thaumarchaeota archaeon]|nr:class III poly(R)-hydroxyalkanoic acid synthase subunit PhaC [Nitrososphaerota archaeon]